MNMPPCPPDWVWQDGPSDGLGKYLQLSPLKMKQKVRGRSVRKEDYNIWD